MDIQLKVIGREKATERHSLECPWVALESWYIFPKVELYDFDGHSRYGSPKVSRSELA
jgi:hypothetical protein